ncbi:unnamed protein product [Wickerhamomyces anomalus]
MKVSTIPSLYYYDPTNIFQKVFNYYEPLNFLLRGFGKETWEYSPVYAIRSWAYLLPYSIPLFPITKAIDTFQLQPQIAFYSTRLLVVSFTLYSELHLYGTLKNSIDFDLSGLYILFSALSPGMSHASVALLPSSFAMNCTCLAMSNLIKYFHKRAMKNALLVTFWFAIGGLFGWPFVLILAVLPTLVVIKQNIHIFKLFKRFVGWSIFIVLVLIGICVEIDSQFYQKTVLVPLNIVLYNVVFADENAGPNIFGVEPLSYYIINLLLNFHLLAILGYIGVALVPLLSSIISISKNNKLSSLETLTILSPIVVWSGIFFSQPHKEERFLYPIYSIIILSASFTTRYILESISVAVNKFIKKPAKLGNLFYLIGLFSILANVKIISILRINSLSSNYIAPLNVYNHIPANASGNLCVGREWYRYPSSFFLPKDLRLRFIKSNFDGLLPGDFNETLSTLDSISSVPPNMNNLNKFDPSKLFEFDQCDYAIDINQPIDQESNEIGFIDEQNNVRKGWELIHSEQFLNNPESVGPARILKFPNPFPQIPGSELVYHQYNLYKKNNDTTKHQYDLISMK